MNLKGRAAPPRRLIVLIAALTVVPLATFLWLGLRLLEQDRVLEEQQGRTRLQTSADLIVATLQRGMASSEQKFGLAASEWPPGVIAVTFGDDRVDVRPAGRLAFLPAPASLAEVPLDAFDAAERLEFRGRRSQATAAYRALSTSRDPAIRAGALLRLARTLAASTDYSGAMTAYARLRDVDDVLEQGVPLGLAAAWARCRLMEQLGNEEDVRAEAARLANDLTRGRWPVTEGTYVVYARDAAAWTGRASGASRSEVFASAVSQLWNAVAGRTTAASAGHSQLLRIKGELLTVIWSTSGDALRAVVADDSYVRSAWLSAAEQVAHEQNVAFEVREGGGQALALGRAEGGVSGLRGSEVIVTAGQSRLPWDLVVTSTEGLSAAFFWRRRLLLGGFALLVALSLAASWLIIRAVARELAAARLQSDFVAAVSHEFRTPLTALRQFTDMLREQPGLDGERRRLCYEAQSRATERLTRLVQSVLDFGRMEAGAHTYRMEPRDCADLVERVVDDFRLQPSASDRRLALHRNGAAPIEADDEALSRAVWNLLDNAVKYSPDGGAIEVDVNQTADGVAIVVRDHGLGIPPHERNTIFRKFQRGETARIRGIKGTGIGLAMVDEIVRAHRGRVDVESREGEGSTFSIVLPARS